MQAQVVAAYVCRLLNTLLKNGNILGPSAINGAVWDLLI